MADFEASCLMVEESDFPMHSQEKHASQSAADPHRFQQPVRGAMLPGKKSIFGGN
jgi:hypothetical protein